MANIFFLLVYLGGGFVWSETHGFWSSIFWPYHLGKAVARSAQQAAE